MYADLNVAENLRYIAEVLGAPHSDPARVLEQVGLRAQERDMVGRLSGGERAHVSLAAALLGAPELPVLDEPTVGLDPVLRQELWQLFHGLADEGTTLLVSSHVLDEAERCTRLLLMRDGRLLAADGTPTGFLTATGTASVEQAFLQLVADPDAPMIPETETSLRRPFASGAPGGPAGAWAPAPGGRERAAADHAHVAPERADLLQSAQLQHQVVTVYGESRHGFTSRPPLSAGSAIRAPLLIRRGSV